MKNSPWKPIESAPKLKEEQHCSGDWILGVDQFSEIRVICWTIEYPSTGEWMFAYEPNDYIPGIQGFKPTHWMKLPEPPSKYIT